ncbi:putative alpha-tubulin N-acetyltransferase [Toxoplasma gondii VAND]|uniref:Alpha-tubulin N-acetyltransferase n=1 Tax=Toxoplasma gondii VAND TaxID=933077 RepID=A0A086PUH1_TOXGO|nr:putative alpha-tubulin N-acetyltransferase [Toxoplasma gondii VAND]
MEVPFEFLHCRGCAPPLPSMKRFQKEGASAPSSSPEPLQKLSLQSCSATFVLDRSLLSQIAAYSKCRPSSLSSSCSRPPSAAVAFDDRHRPSLSSCSSLPPAAATSSSLSTRPNAFCPRAFVFVEPLPSTSQDSSSSSAVSSSSSSAVSSSSSSSSDRLPGGDGLKGAPGYWAQTGSESVNFLAFLRSSIDVLGEKSASAQSIQVAMTSLAKLEGDRQAPARRDEGAESVRLFLRVNKGVLSGFLKTGPKTLWIGNSSGMERINALSLLDFYVLESCQREGHGRRLFECMLATENVRPWQLAYDRPSPKLLSFLSKFFYLRDYIPQANHFVVFDKYFDEKENANEAEGPTKGENDLAGKRLLHSRAVHAVPVVAHTQDRDGDAFERSAEKNTTFRPSSLSGARLKPAPSMPSSSLLSSSLSPFSSEMSLSRSQGAPHRRLERQRASGASPMPGTASSVSTSSHSRDNASRNAFSCFSPILSSSVHSELKGLTRQAAFHRLLPTLQSRSSSLAGDRRDRRAPSPPRQASAGVSLHARPAQSCGASFREPGESEGNLERKLRDADTLKDAAKCTPAQRRGGDTQAKEEQRREERGTGERRNEEPERGEKRRDDQRREQQSSECRADLRRSSNSSCNEASEAYAVSTPATNVEDRQASGRLHAVELRGKQREALSSFETAEKARTRPEGRLPSMTSGRLPTPFLERESFVNSAEKCNHTFYTSSSSFRPLFHSREERQDRDAFNKAESSYPTYPAPGPCSPAFRQSSSFAASLPPSAHALPPCNRSTSSSSSLSCLLSKSGVSRDFDRGGDGWSVGEKSSPAGIFEEGEREASRLRKYFHSTGDKAGDAAPTAEAPRERARGAEVHTERGPLKSRRGENEKETEKRIEKGLPGGGAHLRSVQVASLLNWS